MVGERLTKGRAARFEKLAPTELKNISVAMELFRVVLPWEHKSDVRSEIRRGEGHRYSKSEQRKARTRERALNRYQIDQGRFRRARPRISPAEVKEIIADALSETISLKKD